MQWVTENQSVSRILPPAKLELKIAKSGTSTLAMNVFKDLLGALRVRLLPEDGDQQGSAGRANQD